MYAVKGRFNFCKFVAKSIQVIKMPKVWRVRQVFQFIYFESGQIIELLEDPTDRYKLYYRTQIMVF